MTEQTVFSNARLVLPDRVIEGAITVADGVITQIDEGATRSGDIDCGGAFIAPGLVELHTDNLERHMTPRPNVGWPAVAAILGHDRELAACGITSVFDAIRVGAIVSDGAKRYGRYARTLADELHTLDRRGALKISHRIHLRAEICSETLGEELAEFDSDDRVGILSVMDHTPGQRQFRDLAKFEAYVRGKHAMSADAFAQHIDLRHALRQSHGDAHEQAAFAAAHRLGAVLASHDDTTAAQVAQSAARGMQLAEFPTTIDAAQACAAHGVATMMGAPNLVRGASHSGNVAASTLAQAGLLDILSSDYVPAALLHGALMLAEMWNDLPRAIATVTYAPARAAGLPDRGALQVGQRGDLIVFDTLGTSPLLHQTWVTGRRVA
ncbi:alpha-D-ribose 1-methylphosphonate 5-triphosphate diphosphatase [Sulfitobacter sp. S190]|uniref:alpha-D-ribose 1-methylphosphonate 5-triphosphate diphosphatase n=1 Tax=Sulfitobacter sp. S190 TaxID=2867022 RepID=UPI0021A8AF15|nr:alpha-D-ribose 1-methylphosphonate 5-triphosphate diphosphatase [Sulfitobacter sp. S190]UWR21863.1 alpha-D-ribose 1-methylphosphonate 5-triphosphate diphosphatase [Sulfitobacter sp. S190]